MADVIEFMERMGGDAKLSQAPPDELASAMRDSGIAAELQSAMLARDGQRLGALLGAAPTCPLVAPPSPTPGPHPGQPAPPPPPPPPPTKKQRARGSTA